MELSDVTNFFSYAINEVDHRDVDDRNEGNAVHNSTVGNLEKIGNFLTAPARWLASDLCDGGKDHFVAVVKKNINIPDIEPREHIDVTHSYESRESEKEGIKKGFLILCEIILALALSPFILIGYVFKCIALCDKETRLKHKVTEVQLNKEEREYLRDRMQKRMDAKNPETAPRAGSEPRGDSSLDFVLLCCWCCIMCCQPCCQPKRD